MSLITPDFGLLVWMTLIFAIVFFILAKFGFPMITKMVHEREDRINESILKAKEAEQSLRDLSEKQAELLDETRKERARMLSDAASLRDEMISKAKAAATEEAAKIIADAREKIESEKAEAIREIRSSVALLSINVAEKIMREDLSKDERQLSLINRMVDEVDMGKDIS